MSPEYFHNSLTYYEARDYLEGIDRRYRAHYVAARSINALIGGLFVKDYTPPQFSWEKEQASASHTYTQEEKEALIAAAEQFTQRLNNRKQS